MRHSKVLLVGQIISTALFAFIISYYFDILSTSASKNDASIIGTLIGLRIMAPHLLTFGLGAVFGWVGYGTNKRSMTLTAGILYCASLIFGLNNFYFLILPILLTFIGYAKQGHIINSSHSSSYNEREDETQTEKTPQPQKEPINKKEVFKRIVLTLVIALIIVLFLPLFANSDEIDLSSLSYDELVALRDKIDLAIWNSQEWQEVFVPIGTYEIGKDIPSGHWTIYAASGAYSNIKWGNKIKNGNVSFSDFIDSTCLKSKQRRNFDINDDIESHDYELKDGQFLQFEHGSVIFTPYAGKPSLGFK